MFELSGHQMQGKKIYTRGQYKYTSESKKDKNVYFEDFILFVVREGTVKYKGYNREPVQ